MEGAEFSMPVVQNKGFTESAKVKAHRETAKKNDSLSEYQKRYKALNTACQKLLSDIYGNDINDFTYSIPGEKDLNYKSVFEGLFSQALESGVLKSREYTDPEGKLHTSEGSIAFRRGSFVDLISKQAKISRSEDGKWNTKDDLSFAFYDIKDFRQADLANDKKGNSAADYILNDVISAMNSEITDSGLQDKIYVCRYGGDEIILGGTGATPGQLKEIDKRIKERVKKIEGWYRRPGTTTDEKRSVEFNEEKEHFFHLSNKEQVGVDALNKNIFLSYLKRGLFLNSDEVQKILSRYTTTSEGGGSPSIDEAKLLEDLKPHSIYPNTGESSIFKEDDSPTMIRKKKVDYICKNNPQLTVAVRLAQEIDDVESKRNKTFTHKRTDAILHFIESAIYDPVLEYNIYSFTDFAENLRADKFKMIRVIDFKFLKEINDKYSIVEGDECVQSAWIKIDEVMKGMPEVRAKLRIGRRGGTFFLGMDAGNPLTENELVQLNKKIGSSLQDVEIDLRGKKVTVPLGLSSFVDTNRKQQRDNKSEEDYLDQVLGQAISQSEEDWFIKIAKNKFTFGKRKNAISNKEEEYVIVPSTLSPTEQGLYDLFFNGKRALERIPKLKKALLSKSTPI